MVAYQHSDELGLPGEGVCWIGTDGARQVGYVCFAFVEDPGIGECWRVEVWRVSSNLVDAPHNELLAAMPRAAWLNPERLLSSPCRRPSDDVYRLRLNVLVADLADHAGDLLLMTLLADGMSVTKALEALRLVG